MGNRYFDFVKRGRPTEYQNDRRDPLSQKKHEYKNFKPLGGAPGYSEALNGPKSRF